MVKSWGEGIIAEIRRGVSSEDHKGERVRR